MYTLIKRSVASLSGPDLLNDNSYFLFYKTLRGLEFQLMVKVFVVLSVNFSEIQQLRVFCLRFFAYVRVYFSLINSLSAKTFQI